MSSKVFSFGTPLHPDTTLINAAQQRDFNDNKIYRTGGIENILDSEQTLKEHNEKLATENIEGVEYINLSKLPDEFIAYEYVREIIKNKHSSSCLAQFLFNLKPTF